MSDQPTPAADKDPQTFSREYVSELRAENKGLRLKNQELTGKVDSFEATKADAIKVAVEAAVVAAKAEATTEVQAEADKRVLLAELKSEAVKAGMVDVDGLKLADLSSVTLKDGKLEGAEALFTGLKESKPYLFGKPPTSSSNPQTPPSPVPPVAKKVTEMDDKEYAAAKAAALKA
ncbi:hypothetical protein [Pseudomonas extremaustralis]|uniref:Scaffolding protein n=1 Tax=Pseudomonas extremaustralis TaxID=359110 RepID=A0A5C5Q6Z0_9PSED|nr:hypothetical protein [Pseudomonas extremaustralis]EZI23766.1 hypothetical protein PE143B_0129725 [Pseudomonas extremaustralis 14-3 substr. 14-3b]TWS01513.1 hypothetical protein FIV36_24960 [Pseudomonas extremaustralis]SDG45947.1 hypothetical protein SAMN05216591_6149 [Pseudomonas extremaustralis]